MEHARGMARTQFSRPKIVSALFTPGCSEGVGLLVGALDHILPWRVCLGFALS